MSEGRELPVFTRTIDQDDVACLAEVLRDPNPIHLDADAVRAAGLGDRPINQGPANLAYAVNMLASAFPGAHLRALEARYLANVFAGDRIEATGVVRSRTGDEVVCDFRVVNGAGQDAVVGTATLNMRDEDR